jgi:hypothetical protein
MLRCATIAKLPRFNLNPIRGVQLAKLLSIATSTARNLTGREVTVKSANSLRQKQRESQPPKLESGMERCEN